MLNDLAILINLISGSLSFPYVSSNLREGVRASGCNRIAAITASRFPLDPSPNEWLPALKVPDLKTCAIS